MKILEVKRINLKLFIFCRYTASFTFKISEVQDFRYF